MVGFEPDPNMRRQFVASQTPATIIDRIEESVVPLGSFTHIFCQEVLEHLGRPERDVLFDSIERLASPETRIIFAVPIEHGLPGLAKNIFRSTLGTERVRLGTMMRAALGLRVNRTSSDTPFGRYIYSHAGFNVRALEREIGIRFDITDRFNDPFGGPWMAINNGRTIVCRLRQREPVFGVEHDVTIQKRPLEG